MNMNYKYFSLLFLLYLVIPNILFGINIINKNNLNIVLSDSPVLQYNLDSAIVNMPYGEVYKNETANDITVILPTTSLEYDNVANVYELINGKVPGLIGNNNIRGIGSALVIIDGVPLDINSLNVNEIEQITILKDVNSSLFYGTRAQNGVILIKTKRGKPNQNKITATLETGLNNPISFPNYLGSAEYMQLYNEALKNDRLNPLYSQEEIESTKSGINRLKFPDMNYYTSEFLKEFKPQSRITTDFSGGNNTSQYYLSLGWHNTGSLMNKGGDESSNRLNLRSNLDFKIGNIIKAKLNVLGVFDLNNRVNGNFFNDASVLRPNAYAPLIDSALVTDKALLSAATLVEGKYLVGGSSIYRNNPYGYLNIGGYNKSNNILVRFNNGYNVDLGLITKGLSLSLDIGFDFYNQYTTVQTNTYAVYQPSWNKENEMSLSKIGNDFFTGAQGLSNTYLNRKTNFSGMIDYQRVFNKDHAFAFSLLAYYESYNETQQIYTRKHAHLSNQINYAFKNKYIVNMSNAIPYSNKLSPNNRLAFSPSLGLAWITSAEDFFNVSFIDFLKLRISGGIMNTDVAITDYYRYQDIFAREWGFNWNDGSRGNQSTIVSNLGNPNLFYEKRKEINLGFESLLFNKEILLQASIFQEYKLDRVISSENRFPNYLGGLNPLINYAEDKFYGIELGLNWRKNISDFSFDLGTSVIYYKSKVIRRDEYWPEEYLYRVGKPTNAYWGLESLGLFKDESDISNHATQKFGEVQPGDIKYKDQNNDGIIDNNDIIMLKNASAPFVGGISLRLNYKNFSFFAHSTFRTGAYSISNNSYYWIYGDRKYSEVVRNRWTENTSNTATYPRLSSTFNSNNFRTSSYWLYDNSMFSIDRLQLSYYFPKHIASKLFTSDIQLYARANNILTFAKNRDKLQLNVETEPQYRFYALGLKVTFN